MTNRIPDKVLVSVTDAESGISWDMELPTQMPAKELALGISRFLRENGKMPFRSSAGDRIWFHDRRLLDDDTLASLEIWDGSEITIHKRKEGGRCI